MDCSFCARPLRDVTVLRLTASLEHALSFLRPPVHRLYHMCPDCLQAIKLTTPEEFSTTITAAIFALIEANTPQPHQPQGEPVP